MGCCENKNSGFLKSEHNELENSPVNYNSREELEKTIENNTSFFFVFLIFYYKFIKFNFFRSLV